MSTCPSAPQQTPLGLREFVTLMALLTSMVAMSIDAMLPALAQIGTDLGAADDNDRQWVLTSLFLGMALSQVFYGPLSDRYGRKPTIYTGLAIFIVGTLLAALAVNFSMMLAGRFLQGVGAAGPRIVTMALVRDQHRGDAMAKIMSLIMTVFIAVPVIAPALGQGILLIAHWRAIFVVLLVQALLGLIWFALRQPETLPPERRIPLSPQRLSAAFLEVLHQREAVGYTLAGGLVFGAFMGFLISSQQILQEQYQLGEAFPLYFALLALALGTASYGNSRLVTRYGMRVMSRRALLILGVVTPLYWMLALLADGQPPLWSLLAYLLITFGALGILLGNLNSLAMEPLGHIAGIAAALISSVTTLMALGFGTLIGLSYRGTVLPLTGGFALLSLAALAVVLHTERARAA